MIIMFKSKKLEKESNNFDFLQRRYGLERARLIRRRLDELQAAEILEDLRSLPQARCHELTGKQAEQLSVDLVYPYRLVFQPAHNPLPRKPDGGLDWARVTAVKILGVEDTHEQ
jgi:plasmid maintenance system killer protein